MSFLSIPNQFFSIGPSRSFAGISGYVTISEDTTDELEITQQPVAMNAAIADHAFKKPVSITITMLFKGSLLQSLNTTYTQLQQLQIPNVQTGVLSTFSVVTPKRTYTNMLLKTMKLLTNLQYENALDLIMNFQEVIIVSIGTTVIPPSLLANAASNQATQTSGPKQSVLYQGAQAIGAVAP